MDRFKLLDLAVRLKSPNLVIIVYHNIGPSSGSRFRLFEEPFPVELFEKQVLFLIRNGYIVTSLRDALRLLADDTSKKIGVITFDDGYKGVYNFAYPILKKYQVKATLYVTAGFVKHKTVPWWEQLYFIFNEARRSGRLGELIRSVRKWRETLLVREVGDSEYYVRLLIERIVRELNDSELRHLIHLLSENLNTVLPEELYDTIMLNIDEIKEMREYGFEIGGHGTWHINLAKIDKCKRQKEIEESLDLIKSLDPHEDLYTFAYPFGIYNSEIIEDVVDRGFKAAVTLEPRINQFPITNTYTLARIPPLRFGLKNIASLKYSLIMG